MGGGKLTCLMTQSNAAIAPESSDRDGRGRFLPGTGVKGGRKPGVETLANRSLRTMVEAALDRQGGIKYLEMLAQEYPPVFAALLSKLLPPPKPDDAPRDLVQIRAFVSAALAAQAREIAASEPPPETLDIGSDKECTDTRGLSEKAGNAVREGT